MAKQTGLPRALAGRNYSISVRRMQMRQTEMNILAARECHVYIRVFTKGVYNIRGLGT